MCVCVCVCVCVNICMYVCMYMPQGVCVKKDLFHASVRVIHTHYTYGTIHTLTEQYIQKDLFHASVRGNKGGGHSRRFFRCVRVLDH